MTRVFEVSVPRSADGWVVPGLLPNDPAERSFDVGFSVAPYLRGRTRQRPPRSSPGDSRRRGFRSGTLERRGSDPPLSRRSLGGRSRTTRALLTTSCENSNFRAARLVNPGSGSRADRNIPNSSHRNGCYGSLFQKPTPDDGTSVTLGTPTQGRQATFSTSKMSGPGLGFSLRGSTWVDVQGRESTSADDQPMVQRTLQRSRSASASTSPF